MNARIAWLAVAVLTAIAVAAMSGCGGSGSSSSSGVSTTPVNNVLPISVNLGVDNNYADGVFASVTVCVPGTTNCQTIDNVLVDTGSFGLRLLSSEVTLPLPELSDGSGNAIGECLQYADSFNWGPVASADVDLAGETAPAVPIQLLGASGFPSAPADCTDSGLPEDDTQATLGTNGVLGIGVFTYDCGEGCTPLSSSIPPIYFGCSSASCTAELISLDEEVQNPVWLFTQDNNGVMINLPSVAAGGAASVSGTLTFGISTQSDNALSGTVLDTDDYGDIATSYNGTNYSGTALDTGSNGNFFLDPTTVNLPTCAGDESAFYCPNSTTSFSGTNVSAGSGAPTHQSVAWSVANADDLFNTGYAAFSNLAGPNPGYFDFGLPFFFGQPVFIGIDGAVAAGNSGPFYSY